MNQQKSDDEKRPPVTVVFAVWCNIAAFIVISAASSVWVWLALNSNLLAIPFIVIGLILPLVFIVWPCSQMDLLVRASKGEDKESDLPKYVGAAVAGFLCAYPLAFALLCFMLAKNELAAFVGADASFMLFVGFAYDILSKYGGLDVLGTAGFDFSPCQPESILAKMLTLLFVVVNLLVIVKGVRLAFSRLFETLKKLNTTARMYE